MGGNTLNRTPIRTAPVLSLMATILIAVFVSPASAQDRADSGRRPPVAPPKEQAQCERSVRPVLNDKAVTPAKRVDDISPLEAVRKHLRRARLRPPSQKAAVGVSLRAGSGNREQLKA